MIGSTINLINKKKKNSYLITENIYNLKLNLNNEIIPQKQTKGSEMVIIRRTVWTFDVPPATSHASFLLLLNPCPYVDLNSIRFVGHIEWCK